MIKVNGNENHNSKEDGFNQKSNGDFLLKIKEKEKPNVNQLNMSGVINLHVILILLTRFWTGEYMKKIETYMSWMKKPVPLIVMTNRLSGWTMGRP